MNKMLTGSFNLLKQLNVSVILKCIREYGPISRAEVAEKTGLTPASVSKITKDLMQRNFVYEAGVGESSGGRPPILLDLNSQAGYIIGVNLGPEILEVISTDLEVNILASAGEELQNLAQEYVLDELYNLIEQVINASDVGREKIIGIGMAVHGLVNKEEGISIFAPHYHWREVPIQNLIEEKFGLPTFIDNDVRAMALGEKWVGGAQQVSNFITINISNGIGSGIVINDQLYQGSDNSAGEIGHMVVDSEGPQCSCGNYGCLESVASNPQIVKKAEKLIKQGAETKISQLTNDNLQQITVDIICQAANQGDEVAQQILKEVGRYLGIAVSYLLNILNPGQIIIVGDIIQAKQYVFTAMQEVINNKALAIPAENIEIIPTQLDDNTATIGGATLVLEKLFKESEQFKKEA